MKQIYGRSVLEGAPIGNKNAAGPHTGARARMKLMGGNVKKPLVAVGRHGNKAIFARRRPHDSAISYHERSYNMTHLSAKRLASVINAGRKNETLSPESPGWYSIKGRQ
jgi:hypothetical protein